MYFFAENAAETALKLYIGLNKKVLQSSVKRNIRRNKPLFWKQVI